VRKRLERDEQESNVGWGKEERVGKCLPLREFYHEP
jgi:hypothetical protein